MVIAQKRDTRSVVNSVGQNSPDIREAESWSISEVVRTINQRNGQTFAGSWVHCGLSEPSSYLAHSVRKILPPTEL